MSNLIRDNMRIERLRGRKFKASLGQAQGTGKTEKQAKDACEAAVLSIITNERDTKMEIRDGYLIVSRVTDADQGWYLIKQLADPLSNHFTAKNEFLHPQCFMRAVGLEAAINSHLEQYKDNELAPVAPIYTGEPMTPGFAVFNCHCNNARERAKELFIARFGITKWAEKIKPFHDKGIMSIFNEKPNKYTQWYVDTITAIVNEHATEKTQEAK